MTLDASFEYTTGHSSMIKLLSQIKTHPGIKPYRHLAIFLFVVSIAMAMTALACQAQPSASSRERQGVEAAQLDEREGGPRATHEETIAARTATPSSLEPAAGEAQRAASTLPTEPLPSHRPSAVDHQAEAPVAVAAVSIDRPTAVTEQPKTELDAARQIIPIVKTGLPSGPRKPSPTRLIVPSIGIDTNVIALGTHYNDQDELVWDTAPFAAGHHTGTANPGERGNVVISGHISSIKEGAVFKNLPRIAVGDGVVIITRDRDYLYQVVDREVVEPQQVAVMNPTPEETLTIITCVPDGIYTHRLIVRAKRI